MPINARCSQLSIVNSGVTGHKPTKFISNVHCVSKMTLTLHIITSMHINWFR